MDNEQTTDVIDSPSPAVEAPQSEGAASAPAGEQGEQTTSVEQSTEEAAAPFQLPENDDDLKGQENNPHVQAIIQMRQELRARDQSLDSYKPLDAWKPVVETIGDPSLAQSHYELVSAIHTPDSNNPSGFTSRPFLERLDQESQGSVQQIFADILSFPEPGPKGEPSTVVRELVRSWGLDPDRVEEYRNIDTLRASGVVTAEQLGKIPDQFHEAFKALSREAQEDLLSLRETNPALAEEHLRNAHRALASEKFQQQQREREQQAEQEKRQQFEQDLTQAVEEGITTEIKSISDSIHQNLSSQWKPSTDDAQNSLEYAKVLSTLATLQYPAYRFIAEGALKAVGASMDGFDEIANRWQEQYANHVTFTKMGDKLQAARALSGATLAKQQMVAKLNDYARRLAQVSGERLAGASAQTAGALAAASARFVPSGNGAAQQGDQNPYMSNPHPVGSQEYYAYNRKIDREYQLTGASMFGN